MKIGITCYPTYGGSGVVATELGKELAALGHEVHFISYALPHRLVNFIENTELISFAENYFDDPEWVGKTALMGSSHYMENVKKEGRKIRAIENEEERIKYITKKEAEYKEKFANPYDAASYGFIDDVIEPRNTRFRIIRAFKTLEHKKQTNPAKKHSNIPL